MQFAKPTGSRLLRVSHARATHFPNSPPPLHRGLSFFLHVSTTAHPPQIQPSISLVPKPLKPQFPLSLFVYPSLLVLLLPQNHHFKPKHKREGKKKTKKKEMKTKVEEKFTEFFERWVLQLEEHLQQLLRVSKLETTQLRQGEAELQALVAKVTTHVKAYYTAKWAAAHDDVLAFFCPVWLSPLENAYLWVTGWKPSTVFRLIESLRKSHLSSLKSLTEAQLKRIEELRVKIRLEEEKVEREMERQQVAMADRRMLELARLAGGGGGSATAVVGHVEGLVEVGLKSMFSGLERVMKAADCVRLKTLKGVLEELTPLQCVDFLASTCMLQIQLRQSGKKRSNYPSTTTQNNGLSNINRSDT